MKKFYKGFNEDLTCRGFQYEEGETYEENRADLCHCGFHACEDPLDCFHYYGPTSSQFREVILDGISDQRELDSKVCATKITIGARLNFSQMVKAAFEFRWPKTTLEPGASATGYNGWLPQQDIKGRLPQQERKESRLPLAIKAAQKDHSAAGSFSPNTTNGTARGIL